MNDKQLLAGCAPTPVGAVERYRGTTSEPPAEVAALGQPEYVTSLSPLYTFPLENWQWFVAAGLVLLVGPFLVAFALPPGNNAPYFLASILGVVALFVPAVAQAKRPKEFPTYQLYKDVLVIADGGEFTVIAWDAIEEWHATGGSFTTADGQRFVLSPHVSGWSAIIGKIYESLTPRKLPGILEAIGRGEAVAFGNITVSTEALTYNGKTIRWENVASIVHVINRGFYRIYQQGALLPNLVFPSDVANCWYLHTALNAACPEHLKISAEDAQKWWRQW